MTPGLEHLAVRSRASESLASTFLAVKWGRNTTASQRPGVKTGCQVVGKVTEARMCWKVRSWHSIQGCQIPEADSFHRMSGPLRAAGGGSGGALG